jgi:hypothetical protein
MLAPAREAFSEAVSDFPGKSKVTVAAQFPNYTGFQHLFVNYLVVYHHVTTLDMVFITAPWPLKYIIASSFGNW